VFTFIVYLNKMYLTIVHCLFRQRAEEDHFELQLLGLSREDEASPKRERRDS